jgi:hypothetical protein
MSGNNQARRNALGITPNPPATIEVTIAASTQNNVESRQG